MEIRRKSPTLNKVTFVNGVQIKKQKWKALMWDNFIYYGKINQNRDSHKCTDGAFYKEIIVYLAVCRGTDCSGKRTKRKEYVFVQENWQQVYCQH